MISTGRIDEINEVMQKKRLEISIIQCYITELLESKSCEGVKIILDEIAKNSRNASEVKKAILDSKTRGAKLIIRYYKELNYTQQSNAIKLLGEIQSKASVSLLKEIFTGPDKWLAMDTISGLRPFVNEDMIPMIFEVIADSDFYRELKVSCVSLLVDIGAPAVPKLIKIVNEGSGVCALYAIQALGEIGDKRATEILCSRLEMNNDYKTRKVIKALGEIRDPGSTLSLCKALVSNPQWKDEIILALGKVGNPQATTTLIDYFNHNCDRFEQAYYEESAFFLIEALGKMKDTRVIEPLTRIFTRSPEKYRMIAMDALENLRNLLGDAAFFSSFYTLPDSIHHNAISAWFHLESGPVKTRCRELLTGENYVIEKSAIGKDQRENNALIACLSLPLGFEKENGEDRAMRFDAIKSIRLFKNEDKP